MASMQHTRSNPAEVIGQVTSRFAGLDPGEFRSTVDGLWQSAKNVGETITDEVESGRITPVQGVALYASITGSLFGWPEFHREIRPSDLALSLSGSGNSGAGNGQ